MEALSSTSVSVVSTNKPFQPVRQDNLLMQTLITNSIFWLIANDMQCLEKEISSINEQIGRQITDHNHALSLQRKELHDYQKLGFSLNNLIGEDRNFKNERLELPFSPLENEWLELAKQFPGERIVPLKSIYYICMAFGMCFAETKYYRGTLEKEVLEKGLDFCSRYRLNPEHTRFYVMAPKKLFKIHRPNPKLDPILCIELMHSRSEYNIWDRLYVPLHFWGEDFSRVTPKKWKCCVGMLTRSLDDWFLGIGFREKKNVYSSSGYSEILRRKIRGAYALKYHQ
ncbi:MAG: hypothetical protein LBI53_02400 [Candidatus Peribacteria bacterium]|nr:hypothetical protein [Candidatus Peribacteria bacterium]